MVILTKTKLMVTQNNHIGHGLLHVKASNICCSTCLCECQCSSACLCERVITYKYQVKSLVEINYEYTCNAEVVSLYLINF